MGAQSSLLTLVGATGLGVSKVADVAVDAAKSLEKEEEVKKEEVKKEDKDAESLKQASTMLKKADAEEELGKLQEEYKPLKEELGQWKKGLVDVGNGNYMQTNEDLSNDIKMRQKALKIMKEKIKARKLQIRTYKNMLGGKK